MAFCILVSSVAPCETTRVVPPLIPCGDCPRFYLQACSSPAIQRCFSSLDPSPPFSLYILRRESPRPVASFTIYQPMIHPLFSYSIPGAPLSSGLVSPVAHWASPRGSFFDVSNVTCLILISWSQLHVSTVHAEVVSTVSPLWVSHRPSIQLRKPSFQHPSWNDSFCTSCVLSWLVFDSLPLIVKFSRILWAGC